VESFATIDEPARQTSAPRASAPALLPPAPEAAAVSDSDSADDASSTDDAASLGGIGVDDLEFMSGFLQQALDGPVAEPLASW
jgi:hypothetical protein